MDLSGSQNEGVAMKLFKKNQILMGLVASVSFMVWSHAAERNLYTISGISSGGFMSVQMATIFSKNFSGVGTVAGGFYYCAQNHLQDTIEKDQNTIGMKDLFLIESTPQVLKDVLNPFILLHGANPNEWFQPRKENPTYQAMSICMNQPEKAELPGRLLLKLEADKKIDPLAYFHRQKVFVYQGQNDGVLRPGMAHQLLKYYKSVGVPETSIAFETSQGGHNFPTDLEGQNECQAEAVPYVSSCQNDLAGKMLKHLLGRDLLRAQAVPEHIYVVDQNLNQVNQGKTRSEWTQPTKSVAPYAYLYASDECLANPKSCQMHIALHGCQMTDSFSTEFQKRYAQQILLTQIVNMRSEKNSANMFFPPIALSFFSLPVIEEKENKLGLLKFVMDSGYIKYAEKNNLMILFPQTWVSEDSFPLNPNGCWDWFGATGKDYANKKGPEASWLMAYIQKISQNPRSFILSSVKPDFADVLKSFSQSTSLVLPPQSSSLGSGPEVMTPQGP